jgi:DNA-binding transcriptional LysR family regulator
MARTIDVNDMLIFAQVADSGGFTAAGRILDMPKSTVSRRISALEAALGVRLLQRTTRTLSLTDVGLIYAERCRALRIEIDEANGIVASAGDTPRGRLRVTAPIELGRRYVAPCLAEFARRYEAVEVELDLSDQARDLVAEGWDLAIRVGELADSSLIARKLGPTHQFLCAAPSYLEGRDPLSRPEDLAAHDTLVMTAGIGGFVWQFEGPTGSVIVTVAPRGEANDFEAVSRMAVGGLGIARLPSWVVREHIQSGALVPLLTDYRPVDLGVYVVYPSRRHVSAKLQRFLELVEERLTPAPWLVRD